MREDVGFKIIGDEHLFDVVGYFFLKKGLIISLFL